MISRVQDRKQDKNRSEGFNAKSNWNLNRDMAGKEGILQRWMRGAGQRESLRNWNLARRRNPFQREEELQRVAIVEACLELIFWTQI
jgi:hypothetical protein